MCNRCETPERLSVCQALQATHARYPRTISELVVDLRSDTVTRLTDGMRKAEVTAPAGWRSIVTGRGFGTLPWQRASGPKSTVRVLRRSRSACPKGSAHR